MKKRSFSLFEVIIACSIVAVMTVFALSQLKGFLTLEHRLQKESHLALDLSYFTLKTKLLLEQSKGFDFTFEEDPIEALSFSFKAHPILGSSSLETGWARLCFENDTLKMLYYPSSPFEEGAQPLKEEIFLSSVKNIEWTFYHYVEKTKSFEILKHWDKQSKNTPQIVTLTITLQKEPSPHTITFFLPEFHKIEFVI